MTDWGLTTGTPALDSVGPIAFGPDSVLFIADSIASRIVAVQVDDNDASFTSGDSVDLDNLESRLAGFLGCSRDEVTVRDMAVHPSSDNVYLSVSRGAGSSATPLIIRVRHADLSIDEVPLTDVPCATVDVTNAPSLDAEVRGRKLRSSTFTDLAYVDGQLLLAGMSNEEFASTLRRVPFPFHGSNEVSSTGVEIFHVSHGAWETAAPIRTFAPYGDDGIVASYTCTPLVRFDKSLLTRATDKVVGRTVAELGAMNSPVDIVTVENEGESYILISNTRLPLIKIATNDVDAQEGLTEAREPRGVPRNELAHTGVTKMARLNGSSVLFIQKEGDGDSALRSFAIASL